MRAAGVYNLMKSATKYYYITVSVTTIFAQHVFAFALGIQLWLRLSGVVFGFGFFEIKRVLLKCPVAVSSTAAGRLLLVII